MGHKQLTYEQRCQIYALKKTPITQAEIAKILGCNQATISRELKRNRGERGYRHKQAQEKSAQRRRNVSVHSNPFFHPAIALATLTSNS